MASDLPPTKAKPKGGREHGLWDMPQIDPAVAPVVEQVYRQYPTLAKHRDKFAVIKGRPMVSGDDRQLESYPIDESFNPMPGYYTTELYNSAVSPAEQAQLIAGDFLHFLPSLDQQWAAMKDDVVPREIQRDSHDYMTRGDAYLRGYLTPDAADEWRKAGVYKPEQVKKLERMKSYLLGQQVP